MFIAGYVIGGLLIVGSILGGIFRSLEETFGGDVSPNSDIILAIFFIGGCLILLISRIGDRVSRYIRRQEDEGSD